MSYFFVFCAGLMLGGAMSGDREREGMVLGCILTVLGIVFAAGHAIALVK